MADICDQAQIQNERAFEYELQSSRKPEGPKANGTCHYCGEEVEDGKRWCGIACRNDWQRIQSKRFPVA